MTNEKRFSAFVQEAFALAEHVMEHDEEYPDRFVAVPITNPMAATLLSEGRRRLLADLKDHGEHRSIASLAACLHRDPTRVSRDLQPLIRIGLVETQRQGKEKAVRATGRPLIIQ